MPASYTIRRSVPRNTRRSKPASTPSTCFPSFSINLFMAFPLPRGDLSSNTTNIIREQKTPSPFGCGYAALWTSSGGGGGAVGWLNTKMWAQTHDEQKSQGWTALILDTNGNGKRDDYVEPNQPVDPTKDKRIPGAFYGVTVSPADGSIWGTVLGFPGAVVRLSPGSNPPA